MLSQCAWPLDAVDDIATLVLPTNDPRITCHTSATTAAVTSAGILGKSLTAATASSQQASFFAMPHRMQREPSTSSPGGALVMQRDSTTEVDELQQLSSLLMQSSPACSPAMWAQQLPGLDSLPPSTTLGPTQSDMPGPMTFQLPPAMPPLTGAQPSSTVSELPNGVRHGLSVER